MTEPRRPGRIQGEWIWKNSLLNHPDSFLLMRKEFVCNLVELETNLWISANCAYQLFINGRFVGFGPRAHQNCGTSYIDLHEVTYYLESGINVIAVLVYYNADQGGCNRHTPGLWCQMEAQGKIILCSDSTWAVREGGCFCTPRARISKDQGMSQYFNADDCPLNWTTPVPDRRLLHIRKLADLDILEEVLSAGRHVEHAENIQQRRLAGAGGPDEADEFSALDRRIDPFQDGNLQIPGKIGLADIDQPDNVLRPGRSRRIIRHYFESCVFWYGRYR